MPTNGEKQPQWLMICKCGATGKASANKTGITPFGRSAAGPKGGLRAGVAETRPATGDVRPVPPASRTRNDRGPLEGRDHGIREGVTITLEQHLPLESARAHNGKTGQDLFPPGAEIGRQQCHL